ncbi:unnamed protein product [Cyclocybe aegerita]|uniref:Histone H1 n=1 Tax=Cyclocybe aegerita TaxID=1973307 RepID=A0A8S0WD00_CYCAE|nr:unnamed protein product [Cyclocybe aegerita]
MQVASAYPSSLHHPHYHTYYQLHTPGPQDHELKRQYLAFLPPQQIIEICLTFDAYVSPYVRSTVWPLDLSSAIAALQKAKSTSDATEKSSSESSRKDGVAVMDSLNPPDEKEDTPAPSESTSRTEPLPPDKGKSSTPGPPSTSTVSAPAPSISSTSSAQPESTSSTASTSTAPAPSAESTTFTQGTAALTHAPAPTPQPIPPYPYGYGHLPAAYPHTPYYATGYPYPYTYPTMQNGYHHPPPPPPHPQPQPPTYATTQTSMYNNMVPLPPPQDGVSADDLPSYEEMLVEALTDCTEPDGLAPKDLFAWMASRYPVQSNFRPSASQALQKAFRRGRFEKSSNGRYRLNATWEGGNTSRRTTRRPQIHGGLPPPPTTTTGSSTPIPPFTHAPLVHHHHGRTTSSSTQYPYGYPHPGYTGFGAQPASSAAGFSSTALKTIQPVTSDGPTADAYEAAQNILKAINFGGLLSMPSDDDQHHNESRAKDDRAQEAASIANGVENLLSHVQAVLAANAAGAEAQSAAGPVAVAGGAIAPAVPTPPADPRAELQAQLALLSAQLAELGQLESAPVPTNIIAPAPVAPAMATLVPDEPQGVLPASMPAPVQEVLPLEALPEEDEESDDDDMEEVI